jgi:hypothetical protein
MIDMAWAMSVFSSSRSRIGASGMVSDPSQGQLMVFTTILH